MRTLGKFRPRARITFLLILCFHPYQATLILHFMIHCMRYDKNKD
ncbi:Uncharacterised protein [Legionella sainthelensi]|nr:Uncharacterised protein [Legionella sainthelensi]